jgi:hypothetical protein
MQQVAIDTGEAVSRPVGSAVSRKRAAVDELIRLGRVTAALELQAAKAARSRDGAVLLPVEAVGRVREVVINSGRTMRSIGQQQSRVLADDLDEVECHLEGWLLGGQWVVNGQQQVAVTADQLAQASAVLSDLLPYMVEHLARVGWVELEAP